MTRINLSDPIFLNSDACHNIPKHKPSRQNRYFKLVFLLLGSTAILPALFTTGAQAACGGTAICVTRTTDTGDANVTGSLSWAISQANRGGDQTIAFDPDAFAGKDPRLTLTGTNAQTTRIAAGVTIDGSGVPGLTIDGSNQREIFFVRPDNPGSGSPIDVNIRNLNLANGRAKGGDGGSGINNTGYSSGGGMGAGGALFAGKGSNVTIENVNLAGNRAQGGNAGTSGQNCCTPTGTGGGGLNGGNGEANTGGHGGGGGGLGAGANGANHRGGGPAGGAQGGGNGGNYSGGGGGNNGKGGKGGFGGGGGGGDAGLNPAGGGDGGFGGGGGGAGGIDGVYSKGGNGGFGGGAGGNARGEGSTAGYGGGHSGINAGGGGAGFGGAVFTEDGGSLTYKGKGTLSGGSVSGGNGYFGGNGLGLGSGVFLNGTNSLTVAADEGETITIYDDIVSDAYNGPGFANNADPAGDGVDHGVIHNGKGTLALRGNNTYVGGTTINSGKVNVAADKNLGHASGGVRIDGGVLQFAESFDSNRKITLGKKTGSDNASNRSLMSAAKDSTAENNNIIDTQNNNITLNGVIDGSGPLTKIGTGALTLTAVDTYTGDTNIDQGALKLAGSGSIAQSNRVKADTVFDISGVSGPSSTIRSLAGGKAGQVHLGGKDLILSNANDMFEGVIDGAGGLDVDGGWETLTGANTYAGGTTIGKAAVLQLGNGGNSGSITGDVDNDGTFIFNRSDAYTFEGDISGTGDLHQIGSGKTILTGKNDYSGITTVDIGTLAAGARETFSANSDHIVKQRTVLELAGYDQTVKSLANAGLVDLGGKPGTVLTAREAYTGQDGFVHFNTVLEGDDAPTDLLRVGGGTSGTSNVIITNIDGKGELTQEGIKIIDVDGASDGTFQLVGNYQAKGKQAIGFGAYSYSLEKNGIATPADGDWYLRGTYQPGVALYEAYPQLLLAMNTLPTLKQRVGNRYWSGAGNLMIEQGDGPGIADVPPTPDAAVSAVSGPLVERQAVWGRMEASRGTMRPDTSTSKADYDQTLWKAQAGLDGQLYENQSGVVIASLTGHYATGTADVSSPYGDGKIDTKGYGVGGALTWYGYDGFYLDGQAQATWYKTDLTSSRLESSMASGLKGFGYAVGLETGRRFDLNDNWTLTPQAQLVYSSIDFDDFVDRVPFLANVSLLRGDSLLGRTGLQLDYQHSWQAGNGTTSRISAYGAGNFYYEFLNGTEVSVGSTRKVNFASENDRIWGGIGLGGSYNWSDDRYSLYGEAFARTSLADFGDSYSLGGTLGLRIKW
ncbi:hypothetical protein C5748_06690 [Phyllobacterium phragmitis]|uniref:Autotransporter domain-containing protein n=1 Tax=Phyllobacterium phragmitis TaxID=2670329 RepID=A0A2S9IUR9_9HYPH|nr:autotransporter outer membrane beta-barrel domain-containing protein [Phyllobacterium phragmitis]PRD44274.1 hypothetical protein C5748_06690 [Phyllobacterium phragmitis]